MCSDASRDSHRFKDAIEAAIEEGKVKRFKHFKEWAAAVALKLRPKNPLAKPKRSKAKADQSNSEQALVAAIRSAPRSS